MKRVLAALIVGTATLGVAPGQPPPAPGPGIRLIANQLENGLFANARISAAAWVKANPGGPRVAMAQLNKGGLGVADRGIEVVLSSVGRNEPTPAMMKKQKAAYVQMAYDIAAVGLVIGAMPPPAKHGALWIKHSTDLRDESLKLAKAASDGDPAAFKEAANRVNQVCHGCHSKAR